MRHTVSVIIPTYNRAGLVPEAIKSVLDQQLEKDWKLDVVVVDDGSTDNTEGVVKKFGNKVRYFKIKHSGLPAVARNFGISKSHGDLVAFLDSDDLWLEDKLMHQVPQLEDPSLAMNYGASKFINVDGKKLGRSVVDHNKIRKGEKFATLIKENVIANSTVIVKKGVIERIGGFSESVQLRAVEDYELWLRIVATYPQGIKSIAKTVSFLRTHSGNISAAGHILALERILAVYDNIRETVGLSKQQRLELEKQIWVMHQNWGRLKDEEGDIPSLSVVMGIYKDKKFVKRAVQSVLDQTFKDFELIIINDGSSDGSLDIVKKFKDPRIRIVNQTNHGLVYTLNKGIGLARADFIARQDADDISLPERFAKELSLLLADSDVGLVGCFFAYIDEDGSEPTGVVITSPTKHIDILRNMYFDNPIGHGSVIMRKQAAIDAGGYRDDYGPNEDYDLWRRIAKSWKIGQIPEVLYHYRFSSNSISRTKKEIQHNFFAKLTEDIWREQKAHKGIREIVADARFYASLDSPYKNFVRRQYIEQQYHLSFLFLIHGRLREGYKTALALLALDPRLTFKLWKTLLWAPIKSLMGRNL